MADPLPIIVITAGATAFATKLTEEVWAGAKKLIGSYQSEKATKTAEERCAKMMSFLAKRLSRLEEDIRFDRALFQTNLEDPDFGTILKTTFSAAAESDGSGGGRDR